MSFVLPPLQLIQQRKQIIYACVDKQQDVKQTFYILQTLGLFRHCRQERDKREN